MAAVDIIIPVYNSAAYLSEAVESILNQTVSDWNLILVNDGSTDESGAICDSYAAKDPRIHAFHTENCGVSHARNVGLQNSQSEWIMFVDSDDTVEPTILDALFHHSAGMDIVSCCYTISDISDRQLVNKPSSFSGINELSDLFCNNLGILFYCVVWGKIYRKCRLAHSFDESTRHGEDLLFNLCNLSNQTHICIIPDILYNYKYLENNNTSLSSKFWLDTLDFEWKVYQQTAFLFKNEPKAVHSVLVRCKKNIITYFYNIVNLSVLTKPQKLSILAQQLESDLFTVKELDTIDQYELIWSLIRQKKLDKLYDYLYGKSPSALSP